MPTAQAPIHSGYTAATTAEAVIASAAGLAGKVAIVTGGHSGLGLETVRVLAGAGVQVVVPARAPQLAAAALAGLPGVAVAALDLMDAASIAAFSADFLAAGRPLHLLINSAGIMASPLTRDADGHESQFATNHLGHFRLTTQLWPALQRAQGARVVSVSSRGHQICPVNFDDIDFMRRPYDKWQAYGQSKSANALFAVGLDARGASDGIRGYAVHPGAILSPLARHLTADEIARFGVHDAAGQLINDPARDLKNVAQGAATAVWCATSAMLDTLGGVYCENCDIASVETEQRYGVRPWAIDPQQADRLWELSLALAR
ncbi:SDR family NAD(P)-dependent oxidoreductase [Pseudoduganella sp. FT26W]|uniref:Probable oxidoreductase n=1 Tax=Duganella aquatilis TaxID=2666082 RepID=A0A844CUU3_9BURK|nr:oxidoreductase [Duganella aquatilis]MRW83668.1 SDR family NAD(P)-dependent oxidoreductase [Duganella aquatilis]